MSGVLPAPLIIFSTFVGYLAGGLAGGLAMTLGIFLPAFLFPIFLHRWLVAVAENPRIRPFLLGVAAAVVGLIAAVTVEIVETGVVDVPTALLALGAFAALMRFHGKLTVLYVVLGCGLIGVGLQLTLLAKLHSRGDLDDDHGRDNEIDSHAERRPPSRSADEPGAVLPEVLQAMAEQPDDQEPRDPVTAAAATRTKANATLLSTAITFGRPSATAKPT